VNPDINGLLKEQPGSRLFTMFDRLRTEWHVRRRPSPPGKGLLD
jgi:hypothetical protein